MFSPYPCAITKNRGRTNTSRTAPEPCPPALPQWWAIPFPQNPKPWATVPQAHISPWFSAYPNPSDSRRFKFVANPLNHCSDSTAIARSLPMPRNPTRKLQRRKKDKNRRGLLRCRTPAASRAIILTTTDGTDPDGYTALDGAHCKLVYSGSSLFFLELLIVIAWVSITYLQMSGTNKLFVFLQYRLAAWFRSGLLHANFLKQRK